MNVRTAILFGATAAALGLSACGDKAKEVADQIQGKADALSMNDQWGSACGNTRLDVFDISSQTELYDFGASLSKTTTFYREDNCAVPVLQVVETGSYTRGSEVSTGVYPLDMTFNRVTITPLNQDGVDTLKTFNACKRSDWAVGKAIDVTGATSDTPMSPTVRCWQKPHTYYDLVEVTANELRFGLVKEGTTTLSPENRPTEIDKGQVWTRK